MADASGPSGGGYDYVQDSTNAPTNPKLGEEWYQPDTDDVKTYDGGTWVDVKISDHSQLSGVAAGDHFSPGGGLSFSSGALELLLSGYLELDGNGDLAISAGSVGEDRLAFSTPTQSELDSHTGDTTNPHNVTDSQTGAASALSNHADNENAHRRMEKIRITSFSSLGDVDDEGSGNWPSSFGSTPYVAASIISSAERSTMQVTSRSTTAVTVFEWNRYNTSDTEPDAIEVIGLE